MIGKLLAAPVRLLNAPFRVVEVAVAFAVGDKHAERIMSAPLEGVAKGIESAADDITGGKP